MNSSTDTIVVFTFICIRCSYISKPAYTRDVLAEGYFLWSSNCGVAIMKKIEDAEMTKKIAQICSDLIIPFLTLADRDDTSN